MTRVRVATIVTRFQEGAGTVALRGALGLDPRRFDNTIIAGSGNHLLDQAQAAGLPVHLVPALRSPIDPRNDVRALRQLTTLLARGRYDVVHTHSAKAGTLGRIAATRAGVPRLVHTFHGFPFHEFQSPARRAAYVQIERRLGALTDVGLCVGTGVAVEAVRRRLLAPERIRTIGVAPPGSVSRNTWDARIHARRALTLPADAVVVGAVGRADYQKGPELFAAAIAALARPHVIGVWIGGGELLPAMRELSRRLAGHADVRYIGERTDVGTLLPAFDVFALPSRYEGVPVAIVEAMMCGIPVVASAVNAVSDLVVPGRTGILVPPARPRAHAGAHPHLLDHPATGRRYAEAARTRVTERHSDRALAEALTAAYLPDEPTEPSDLSSFEEPLWPSPSSTR